ncbi:hypothetical protein D5O23_05005 [Salmonella enterica subsp. enterica]|nr:hypothetical protein [Salmonella enterica subsp. enterica serovar Mokola]
MPSSNDKLKVQLFIVITDSHAHYQNINTRNKIIYIYNNYYTYQKFNISNHFIFSAMINIEK